MELKGCTAIVTGGSGGSGGSGGLGQRICHALARNGVNVVVNYAASGAKAMRMSANWDPQYQAGAASRTLLKRTVDKDEIAEQTLMFCRSDCVTGQTLLVDSGRV